MRAVTTVVLGLLVAVLAGCAAEQGAEPSSDAASTATGDQLSRSDEALRQERQQLLEDYLSALPGSAEVSALGSAMTVAVQGDGWGSSVDASQQVQSASAAKAWWVDAAANAAGTAAVEPYVEDIFVYSSNEAAGEVITLAGGADAVNAYTQSIGMTDTYLASWAAGGNHVASDTATQGDDNLTTTSDCVTFLQSLVQRSQQGDATATTVLEWMRLAPDGFAEDTTYGAALVNNLPFETARATSHKTGWLPPGSATSVQNAMLAIGAVTTPDGDVYSIAISAQDGLDYLRQSVDIARVSRAVFDVAVVPPAE